MRSLILISLLFSSNAFAQYIKATFIYSTEYIPKKEMELKFINKKLSINGKEIVKYQALLNSAEFKMIMGKFDAKSENCLRGTYQLIKTIGTKKSAEIGCLYSTRFKVLEKAYRVLEKSTPIIKLK